MLLSTQPLPVAWNSSGHFPYFILLSGTPMECRSFALNLRFGILLVWLLIAMSSSCLYAQGTKADYDRMKAQGKFNLSLVDRHTIQPRWLPEDQALWYTVRTNPETVEYHLVDISSQTNQLLFTNQQIQDEIGENLKPAARKSLENLDLHFDSELAAATFRIAESAFSYSIADRKFVSIPVESLPKPAKPDTVSVRASGDSTNRITVTFENDSDQAIQLFWVDSGFRARPYQTMEPGTSLQQNTYSGHQWLIRSTTGRNLAFVETQTAGQVITVETGDEIELTVDRVRGRSRSFFLRGNRDGAPASRTRTASRNQSPNQKWRAVIRDHNVVLESESPDNEDKTIPLTDNGTEKKYYTNQFYWSPDSQYLVALLETPAQSHPVHFVESSPKDQLQPKLHTFEYLKPGDEIRTIQPVMISIADRSIVPTESTLYETPWQLYDYHWLEDSSEFVFRYNQRGHQVMRVIGLSPSGETRTIVDEVSPTFIDYTGKSWVRYLWERNELLWASERSGWNHLYRYDVKSGTVKNAITSGEWVVREVTRVDVENEQIWFAASGVFADQDPYQLHFGRVNFDGSELTWLTEADGHHSITYSPTGKYLIDRYSRMDLPPVHELRNTQDGSKVCDLEKANWDRLVQAGWQAAEPFHAKGRDGTTDIYGVIYRPQNFESGKKYPVIEYIYAGPQSAFVPKSFSPGRSEKSLAELGFIVVQIDGMGTSHRSKAFHDVCWKNLGDAGFPDRIAWMKAAARKYPEMDLSRVGIYGGSAGGQNSTRAVLAFGDFYKVAVSDCGCHDNRMDKIWWNEQWMGWPLGDHYAEQSNVTQAHRLEGHLMLMVGEMDRNVDPASTMQVVDALIKADKDFDMLVIPGGGHGSGFGPYGRRRMCDFFVRHLLGVEPRAN